MNKTIPLECYTLILSPEELDNVKELENYIMTQACKKAASLAKTKCNIQKVKIIERKEYDPLGGEINCVEIEYYYTKEYI